MKFYKDVDRMSDIFVLDNGEQYILRWIDHMDMPEHIKSQLQNRINVRAILKTYGRKI